MKTTDQIAYEAATAIEVNGGNLGYKKAVIKAAIEKDREQRYDVLGWEQGYKCAKAELADDMRELEQFRAAQASEQGADTKRLDWLLNYTSKWGYYKTRDDIDAAMPEHLKPRKHVTDGSPCWCNPEVILVKPAQASEPDPEHTKEEFIKRYGRTYDEKPMGELTVEEIDRHLVAHHLTIGLLESRRKELQ